LTHIVRVEEAKKPFHVVVLGAGFGGLTFCKHFHHPNARITLVDRTNHHLFQPLLYQVATCALSATDVAQPIRGILSNRPDITVLLDKATGFDLAQKKVFLEKSTLDYDYLVLALGGHTGYFGHHEWEQFAPGLKTLDDALRLRSRILFAFEKAESETEPLEHDRLMTIVVVGGGPTGVELAGSFAELTRTVMNLDFRRIDPAQAHVILLEGGPRILSHLPPSLSEKAKWQLIHLGVDVKTDTQVKNIREGVVELVNGKIIKAGNIVWAAGVASSPLTKKLGCELDRGGRVKVNPDLSLPGHPEIFAIGDLALVLNADCKPVPGVSPAAMQMGKHVAKIIAAEIGSRPPLTRPAATLSPSDGERDGVRGNAEHTTTQSTARPPFKYWDKGTMATIGRSAAVAVMGKLKLSGYPAWLAWLFVHLIFLVGFRNRTAVLFQWAYSYFSNRRSARIITHQPQEVEED
jgi:NADH dehydrogenase